MIRNKMRKIYIFIASFAFCFCLYAYYYDHPVTVINAHLNSNVSYFKTDVLYRNSESNMQDYSVEYLIKINSDDADKMKNICMDMGGKTDDYDFGRNPVLNSILKSKEFDGVWNDQYDSCVYQNLHNKKYLGLIVNKDIVFFQFIIM